MKKHLKLCLALFIRGENMKHATFICRDKSYLLPLLTAMLIMLTTVIPDNVFAAYQAYGRVSSNFNPTYLEEGGSGSGLTEIGPLYREDDYTHNRMIGQVAASLCTGTIQASAYGEIKTSEASYHSISFTYAILEDTLTFTVAAGTYAEDLVISLSGRIDGSLTSTTATTASSLCNLTTRLTPPFTADDEYIDSWDLTDGNIDVPFELSVVLMTAQTLTSDLDISVDVQMFMSQQAGIGNTEIGSTKVDFCNTARWQSLNLPNGVTLKSSDSGCFLSNPIPSAVPTLSEWGMIIFLILLVGSALWVMRRKQKHNPA